MNKATLLMVCLLIFSMGPGQTRDNNLKVSYISSLLGSPNPKPVTTRKILERDKKLFDEDHDLIYENLNARMETAGPQDRIPVIILYRENTPTAGIYKSRLQQMFANKTPKFVYQNIPAVATELTPEEIKKISKDPWVEHLELDAVAKASIYTASRWFGVWNLHVYGKKFSGDLDGVRGNYTVNDVVIAIADSGINTNHPDFKDKVLVWKDYVNGQSTPYDDNGHGTHVAGVAAGAGKKNFMFNGVAYEAGLVGLKVLDKDGNGDVSNIIQAVDETILNKSQFNIRILNLSLGVPGSSDGKDALSKICNRAVSQGIVVVVAAGNEGPVARTIGSPAAANSVITVGAGADVEENGFYVADFSSRGPTADGRIKPDLWGPGVNIRSPFRALYSDVSGTSFAAPFVSGVVALMIEGNRNLRPATIKSILTSTAQRWDGSRDNETGFGRLQAYQAVMRAANITKDLEPPVVPHIGFDKSTIGAKQQASYVLKVTDRFAFAVTLVELSDGADLDLEIVDSSGKVVAEAKTAKRQETISIPNYRFDSGTYTIRVISFFGSSSYLLNISGDWTQ